MSRSAGFWNASTPWNGGWPNSKPNQPDASAERVEALGREAAFLEAILAYRRHPWRRAVAEPPAIWALGTTRLLDYGGVGPTLFVVPSLVNRAHVLDLMADHSLLRFMAANGTRTLLLDWGAPGTEERGFDLRQYLRERLLPALATVAGPVLLAGYCMGGLLAMAVAEPAEVAGLVLLATPWDFHQPAPPPAFPTEALLAGGDTLSVDTLQALFALRDPDGVAAKYRAFAALDPMSARAKLFVALEDWLNDGIPLAAPVARECLNHWYGANTPGRGIWAPLGAPVRPELVTVPAFVAIPGRDRIVPPESALPLAVSIPGATRHTPRAGHVGMVAGRDAEAALWRPLLGWITARYQPADSRI
jgi:poly(3-hydroxyalkanoate) synthetase